MNLRRASTSSPISVVKMASQAAISSSFTERSRCFLLGLFHVLTLGVAQLFTVAIGRRGFGNCLNYKRRLHVGFDLFVLRDQLTALRSGGQFPVDDVLCALRTEVAHFPEVMFLVEARLDAFESPVLLQLFQFSFQLFDLLRRSLFIAFEISVLGKVDFGKELGYSLIAQTLVQLVEE